MVVALTPSRFPCQPETSRAAFELGERAAHGDAGESAEFAVVFLSEGGYDLPGFAISARPRGALMAN